MSPGREVLMPQIRRVPAERTLTLILRAMDSRVEAMSGMLHGGRGGLKWGRTHKATASGVKAVFGGGGAAPTHPDQGKLWKKTLDIPGGKKRQPFSALVEYVQAQANIHTTVKHR